MILYAVHRTGMYDQGVVGMFDNLEQAEAAKLIAEEHEVDGYHQFEVRTYVLNKNYSQTQKDVRGRPGRGGQSCLLEGEA